MTEEERSALNIFLDLKMISYNEKAIIKAVKDHWPECTNLPVANILAGKNVQTKGTNYPKEKKIRNFLNSEAGQQVIQTILDASQTYQALSAARNGGEVPAKVMETFQQMNKKNLASHSPFNLRIGWRKTPLYLLQNVL